MRPDQQGRWTVVALPTMARRYRSPGQLDQCVMDALGASNRPLGAYEIAARSRKSDMPLAPNQVYRILDRLIARGDVQRVELLASYLPARGKRTGFMVCRACQAVETFDVGELADTLAPLCEAQGFTPSASVIELSGLCTDCAKHPADEPVPAQGSRSRSSRGMQSLLALVAAAGTAVLSAPADAASRAPATVECVVSLEERQRQSGNGGGAGKQRLLLHR